MTNAFHEVVAQLFPAPEHAPDSFSTLLKQRKRPRIAGRKAIAMTVLAVMMLCFTAGAFAIVHTIVEKRAEWEKEKGPMRTWSIEDQAAFSEEVKGEIWQEARYILPREGQIGKEQARQIALDAILGKYGFSEADMSLWTYQESLEYYDADFPEDGSFYSFTWINATETAIHSGGDLYVVHIDPDTGEILLMESNDDLMG